MKTRAPQKKRNKTSKPKADLATHYNEFKEFEGRRYTGMTIGRSHKWHYDQGEWKEKKITPDKWQFSYAVTKRRAGHAPEGSGVPVGTEYHWYILADQTATKLNANDYRTSMTGLKFKLAHKRADSDKWSASERAQRNRLILLLEETIKELRREGPAQTAVNGAATEPPRRNDRGLDGKVSRTGRSSKSSSRTVK